MNLVWLPEAKDDIQRVYTFLLDKDRRAAVRCVRMLKRVADKLLEFPHIGRRVDDETERRELFIPFGAAAYVLRYRIHGESIVIIRVWHSREERL